MKKQENIVTGFISPILLVLYLCIGFIPNLQAVDKIAPQWLGMSILNTITLVFLFLNRKSISNSITLFFNTYLSYLYLGFIIWAGLSYFYAINQTEVIVNITRQFNVMVMYFSMGLLLSQMKVKVKFIASVICVILSIEVYAVLNEALEMLNNGGVIRSDELKGVTANRNITAFSIAIKIPFLLYLIFAFKKQQYKFLGAILLTLSFIALSMIQSRASLLATSFAAVSFVLMNLYLFFKVEKLKKYWGLITYAIIPVIFTLVINQTYLADKGADVVSRAASIVEVTTDDSITARIRYYSGVWEHLSHNPIFGVGLGNWKLKSIDYDKYDVKGYVVPYHAHSDFIQLGAELGWVGFSSYLGLFFLTIFYAFKLISKSDESTEAKVFFFLALTALGVYSVDASLNFPIARPQVLVVWTLILAMLSLHYAKNFSHLKLESGNSSLQKLTLILTICLLLPCIYVTNSVYSSLKGQMILLRDFNSNQYTLPINQVDQVVPDIPNITVTTIPLKSVKARYYFNAKQYDKALALLDEGTSANPYLYYSELLKSQIYQAEGKLDSSLVYAKKAFYGLPNNALHASQLINIINQLRDRETLEEVYELYTSKNEMNNWRNYLVVAKGLYPPGDSVLSQRAEKAIKLFPNNSEIRGLYNEIRVGILGLNQANQNSSQGLNFFNQGDYQNAVVYFEKAIEINPYEYSYYENAATCNYLLGNLNKAVQQIDKVINEMNPLNGKCEYIKAITFIKMGDPVGACPLLLTSKDSGYPQAAAAWEQYCN